MIAFVSGVLATLLLPQLPPLLPSLCLGGTALLWLGAGYLRAQPSIRARFRVVPLRFVLCRPALCRFVPCRFFHCRVAQWRQCLWLLAGLACGALHGHWRLASIIPSYAEQQDVALSGFVTGLPQCRTQRGQPQCQFDVDVIAAQLSDGRPLPLQRVQIVHYGIDAVEPGACVAMTARLKRPHGLFNPGSIDFETAKLRRGIDATGYVRAVRRLGRDERCAAGVATARVWPSRRIAIARNAIRDLIIARFDASAGLVLALVLGDYSLVDRDQWALFDATGTQHLVTVSGLHIGIAAMLGYWFGDLLMLPLRCGGLRRQRFAAGTSFLVALLYALLAGASTPTLRSLLMLSLFLLVRLLRRESSIAATLWAAFATMVIVDPLAATSVGFWLSFGAVAVLVLGLQWRRRRYRFISNLLLPQWVVFVGLAPLLLACFSQLPLVSMLANLVAVPLSTLVLMPVLLLGILCGFAFAPLNTLIATTLDYLCHWLLWCSELPLDAVTLPSTDVVTIVAITLAAGFCLLPRGLWLRPLSLLLGIAVATGDRTPEPALTMEVFDVGQGLAVLVAVGDRHLLFDTGAGWGDDFDVAQITLLPYLRSRGIDALDVLIVSHADMDHAGGVRSVLGSIRTDSVFSGEPVPAAPTAQRCTAGQHWQWGDARLTMLLPGHFREGNNASCVLLIEFRGRRLLLTGDIEAPAEKSLLADATAGALLEGGVDVLVAPHHGSRSSSIPAFVARLQPAHVVFTVGYRNRYGHPHPTVIARYQRVGSVIHRSDRDGLIRFHIDADGTLATVRWRERWQRYWFGSRS